jgi:hypothetical protein
MRGDAACDYCERLALQRGVVFRNRMECNFRRLYWRSTNERKNLSSRIHRRGKAGDSQSETERIAFLREGAAGVCSRFGFDWMIQIFAHACEFRTNVPTYLHARVKSQSSRGLTSLCRISETLLGALEWRFGSSPKGDDIHQHRQNPLAHFPL